MEWMLKMSEWNVGKLQVGNEHGWKCYSYLQKSFIHLSLLEFGLEQGLIMFSWQWSTIFYLFFWSTPSLVFPKLGHLTSFHICQKSHPFQRRVNKARFNSNSTPKASYLKVHTNDNIICICRNDAGYIIRVKHWTIQTIFWLDFQISPPWTSPPHLPNFSLTITT